MSKKRKLHKEYCGEDMHHIFFQKRYYKHGLLKMLRMYPYCRVKIPKSTLHCFIHAKIRSVPTPNPANIKDVLWHLDTLYKFGGINDNDPIEKRLRVLIALFDCIEQPTADALKKQLDIVIKTSKAPK